MIFLRNNAKLTNGMDCLVEYRVFCFYVYDEQIKLCPICQYSMVSISEQVIHTMLGL